MRLSLEFRSVQFVSQICFSTVPVSPLGIFRPFIAWFAWYRKQAFAVLGTDRDELGHPKPRHRHPLWQISEASRLMRSLFCFQGQVWAGASCMSTLREQQSALQLQRFASTR